jgi:mRNA interferase RelE/StbE
VADYDVLIKTSAAKEFERLPPDVASRVARRIESLASNPRPKTARKLEGGPPRWRIRIGDWRVIYAIDDTRRMVEVLYVRHRSKAYE